jgi:hypothetical protein
MLTLIATDVILSSPDLLVPQQSPPSQMMLTESAELHLLEAIGLITSSTYCYWEGDTGTDPVLNSEQYQQKQLEMQAQKRHRQQILEEVTRLIIGHIQSILSHPQLVGFADQLGSCVAHKISSVSSLAKGHSYKSRAKNPEVSFDAATVFDRATAAVVAVAHSLGHLSLVRGKCVIFHHRMIMCMGLRSLEALSHSVPVLLAQCSISRESESSEGHCEEVVQLLNQAMLEFQDGALALVDACLGPALNKCWALLAELESDAYVAPVEAIVGAVKSNPNGKPHVEAPHFEIERVTLQKLSLVFLQHIATQRCDKALYSERNSQYLSAVFDNEILVGLQGGRGRVSRAGGIPLRKASICILTGLVKAWLTCVTVVGDDSNTGATVPPHLSSAMWLFLREKALPTALRACTDGTSLDFRDASAQALLVDLGGLLWTLTSPTCQQDQLRVYFVEALPALGWPPAAASALQNMLLTPGPLGTFKENFKKFIRSAMIS